MIKSFSAFLLLIVLSSCSNYASNGESLYKKSYNGPKLVVPPPLVGSNINHFYDLSNNDKLGSVSLEPPVLKSPV